VNGIVTGNVVGSISAVWGAVAAGLPDGAAEGDAGAEDAAVEGAAADGADALVCWELPEVELHAASVTASAPAPTTAAVRTVRERVDTGISLRGDRW
jgi:hypothetical protein